MNNIRIAKELIKIARKIISFDIRGKKIVFTGYRGDENNPKNSKLYYIYDTGFIEQYNVKTGAHRIIGSLYQQVKKYLKLPEFKGWDEETGKPILDKNHGKQPEDILDINLLKFTETKHYNERMDRIKFINEVIGHSDDVIFVGYKRGENGLDEIHILKRNGIIKICNPRLKTIITEKISRPQQVRNLFLLPEYLGWDIDKNEPILNREHGKKCLDDILLKCNYYFNKNWNEILPSQDTYEKQKQELIEKGIRKMDNIRIAKQLVKIAKSLIALELIGDACYRIMSEQTKQISVNFSINTNDRDKFLGWFDAMLGRPTEIKALGKKYGFQDMPHTTDTKASNGSGMYFSICLKGNANCDMNGLIEELKRIYHCNEVK